MNAVPALLFDATAAAAVFVQAVIVGSFFVRLVFFLHIYPSRLHPFRILDLIFPRIVRPALSCVCVLWTFSQREAV